MDEEEREGKVSAVIPHPNTLPGIQKKKGECIYCHSGFLPCL